MPKLVNEQIPATMLANLLGHSLYRVPIFVTQYGTPPNNTGDMPSRSAWQSNTPAPGTINGATESNSRAYAALATAANTMNPGLSRQPLLPPRCQ